VSQKKRNRAEFYDRMLNIIGGFGEPGNIDLYNRPVIRNEDGSISTVASMTIDDDDGYRVLPTVFEDGIVEPEEAINRAYKSKKHLGRFPNLKLADLYAQVLHKQQEHLYSGY